MRTCARQPVRSRVYTRREGLTVLREIDILVHTFYYRNGVNGEVKETPVEPYDIYNTFTFIFVEGVHFRPLNQSVLWKPRLHVKIEAGLQVGIKLKCFLKQSYHAFMRAIQ